MIRDARESDAEAMSGVFVASITELCREDHCDDPAIIAEWTANKTPENMRTWLSNRDSTMLVAEEDDTIVGVGGFAGTRIMTLYVAPKARFRGISSKMLEHMEQAMSKNGVVTAELSSTATAHRFYLDRGWQDQGAPGRHHFGVASFPMSKDLSQ